MKLIDLQVFKEDRFSIGVEEETGKYYISIPVSNQLVDYEEHYEISREMALKCHDKIAELRELAQHCRTRENDVNLIVKPGRDRGCAQ